MLDILKNRIHGALAGCWIGDAFGAPFEMMSQGQIKTWISKNGFPSGYIDPANNRIKESKVMSPGEATDDWALTAAVANSLIRRGMFDIVDQALEHVYVFQTNPFGMGGTTKNGLKEIQEYFDSRGDSGRSPFTHAANDGCGNGIAMKISPLAIKDALFYIENYRPGHCDVNDIFSLGCLTHGDKRASFMAFFFKRLVEKCLILNNDKKALDFTINTLLKIMESVGGMFGLSGPETNYSITKIDLAIRMSKISDMPIESFIETVGVSSFAIESIPFSIALFLRNPHDMEKILEEAILVGGDCDTNASLACTLFGAYNGIEKIDRKYIDFNEFTKKNFEESTKISNQLIETFGPES